jgi:hypothetical protein
MRPLWPLIHASPEPFVGCFKGAGGSNSCVCSPLDLDESAGRPFSSPCGHWRLKSASDPLRTFHSLAEPRGANLDRFAASDPRSGNVAGLLTLKGIHLH